jgi:site-specific DNA recombinase
MLASANRVLEMLSSGKVSSVNEVAARARLEPGEVTRTRPPAFVAPDIVEAIMAGRRPVGLTANKRKRLCPLMGGERRVLGFAGGS